MGKETFSSEAIKERIAVEVYKTGIDTKHIILKEIQAKIKEYANKEEFRRDAVESLTKLYAEVDDMNIPEVLLEYLLINEKSKRKDNKALERQINDLILALKS